MFGMLNMMPGTPEELLAKIKEPSFVGMYERVKVVAAQAQSQIMKGNKCAVGNRNKGVHLQTIDPKTNKVTKPFSRRVRSPASTVHYKCKFCDQDFASVGCGDARAKCLRHLQRFSGRLGHPDVGDRLVGTFN